jgi:hypothetical protein
MSSLEAPTILRYLPDFCKICAHLLLVELGAVVVVVAVIEVGLLVIVNERCCWWWR